MINDYYCIVRFSWSPYTSKVETYFIGKRKKENTFYPNEKFKRNCWDEEWEAQAVWENKFKEREEEQKANNVLREEREFYKVLPFPENYPFVVEPPEDVWDCFRLLWLEAKVLELEDENKDLERRIEKLEGNVDDGWP